MLSRTSKTLLSYCSKMSSAARISSSNFSGGSSSAGAPQEQQPKKPLTIALVAGVSLGVGYTVLSQLQKSGMDKAVGIENSEWASSTPAEDIKMKVMGLNIFPIVRTFMKLQE